MPERMVPVQSKNTLSTILDRKVICQQSLVDNQTKLSSVNTLSAALVNSLLKAEIEMEPSIVTGVTISRSPMNTRNAGKPFLRC